MRSIGALVLGLLLSGCGLFQQKYDVDGKTGLSTEEAEAAVQQAATDKSWQSRGWAFDGRPHLTNSVLPVMPRDAIDQKLEGAVDVEIIADESGHVSNVKVLHSPGQVLSDEVVKAVSQWVFAPMTIKGVPAKCLYHQTFMFKLPPK